MKSILPNTDHQEPPASSSLTSALHAPRCKTKENKSVGGSQTSCNEFTLHISRSRALCISVARGTPRRCPGRSLPSWRQVELHGKSHVGRHTQFPRSKPRVWCQRCHDASSIPGEHPFDLDLFLFDLELFDLLAAQAPPSTEHRRVMRHGLVRVRSELRPQVFLRASDDAPGWKLLPEPRWRHLTHGPSIPSESVLQFLPLPFDLNSLSVFTAQTLGAGSC